MSPASDGPAPDELVDVIDADGHVIGLANRREVRSRNLLHPAVAILCRDPMGRIYVNRRADSKDVFPGMYDMFVTGIVRSGETYSHAAKRELAEELGIVESEPRYRFDHLYVGDQDQCLIGVFDLRWEGPVRHQASEIAWGSFLTTKELTALMRVNAFVPDGLEILPRLVPSLAPEVKDRRRAAIF